MSKKTKKRAADRRLSLKKGRKEAMQKQYQAWAASGQNGRSKRSKLQNKRATHVRTKRHADGACGNVGCELCSDTRRPRQNEWRSWRGPMLNQRLVRQAAARKRSFANESNDLVSDIALLGRLE